MWSVHVELERTSAEPGSAGLRGVAVRVMRSFEASRSGSAGEERMKGGGVEVKGVVVGGVGRVAEGDMVGVVC